ncbi:MAG: hypothetical protein OXG23_09535 [Chloroflexi bacterium]|nr:hypothetical protein [Chloroflexota bacterium]
MAMNEIDDVVRELNKIGVKLGMDALERKYFSDDSVKGKLDKANEKLDRIISLLESIERKLEGSSY